MQILMYILAYYKDSIELFQQVSYKSEIISCNIITCTLVALINPEVRNIVYFSTLKLIAKRL